VILRAGKPTKLVIARFHAGDSVGCSPSLERPDVSTRFAMIENTNDFFGMSFEYRKTSTQTVHDFVSVGSPRRGMFSHELSRGRESQFGVGASQPNTMSRSLTIPFFRLSHAGP
jgi:hypothetical protein